MYRLFIQSIHMNVLFNTISTISKQKVMWMILHQFYWGEIYYWMMTAMCDWCLFLFGFFGFWCCLCYGDIVSWNLFTVFVLFLKKKQQKNYAMNKRYSYLIDENYYQLVLLAFDFLHHYMDSWDDRTLDMDAIFLIQETCIRIHCCTLRNDTKQ